MKNGLSFEHKVPENVRELAIHCERPIDGAPRVSLEASLRPMVILENAYDGFTFKTNRNRSGSTFDSIK